MQHATNAGFFGAENESAVLNLHTVKPGHIIIKPPANEAELAYTWASNGSKGPERALALPLGPK